MRAFRPRWAPLGFSHHERTKYREDGFAGPAKCVRGTAGIPAGSSSLGGDVKIQFALLLPRDDGARRSPFGTVIAYGKLQSAPTVADYQRAFQGPQGRTVPYRSAHAGLKFNATKYRGSPLCTRNKKVLEMNRKNKIENYIVENKIVNLIRMKKWRKNAGEKMKVTSIMLLKTNVEKMSETWLSIILLKINNV